MRGELIRWMPPPGMVRRRDALDGGQEFVVARVLSHRLDTRPRYARLRLPVAAEFTATAGSEGVHIWYKPGDLGPVAGPLA